MSSLSSSNAATEDTNYRYYAFISYSRKDQEWGEWIQKKIENYRLPTALRHEKSHGEEVPKFVRPIFRDTTDMTPQGGLSLTLKQELMQSKFLIVICSPSSAQPNSQGKHWVNMEIEEFQKMGRGHRIIPVIVEGDPESDDPAVQCYPPALSSLEDKPLGISVHENANSSSVMRSFLRRIGLDGTANNALLKVLAVLLGIKYDNLKRRHHIRARNRALLNAATVCFCMALGFWYYDANYREKIYYYTDYVEKYGVPEGIFPINEAIASKRKRFYRFTYVGRKLKELAALNSFGHLQDHDAYWKERPSKAVFIDYDSSERPKSVQYFNENNEEIRFFVWTQDRKAIDFKPSRVKDSSSPLGMSSSMSHLFKVKSSEQALKRSNIIRFLYDYDANGYAKKVSFMSSAWEDSHTKDFNGAYGYLFERNKHNAIIKKTFMGSDGKPMSTEDGTSSLVFDYTKEGLVESIRFLDIKGNLVRQKYGYAQLVMKYSPEGNIEEMHIIGVDGKTFAIMKGVLDDNGNAIEMNFLDANYTPVNGGKNYTKEKRKYDERGNKIEESFFGLDGKPVLSSDGYAMAKAVFDNKDRVIEESYFGVDGKAILNRSGYAKVLTKFDSHGHMVEQDFRGVDDKPVLVDGAAKVELKYNVRGHVVEMTSYGLNGEITLNAFQFAKLILGYDIRGNRNKIEFFGTDGKPIMSALGCASVTLTYNDFGNIIAAQKYDLEGKLISE